MESLIPHVPRASSAIVSAIANNPEAAKQLVAMASEGASRTYSKYKKRKARVPKKRKLESVPNTKSISHQEVNTSVATGFESLGRKVLYATPLKLIEPPDRNFSYGAAPANVFHLNGFRWCGKFRNTSDLPIHVQIHFVQPTRENITSSDIPVDFFIDNRSPTTKYSDFVNYTTSNGWDPVQDCFKINRRKFNVLKKIEFNLNGLPQVADLSQQETGSSWKAIDQYMKVNNSFEFENTSSTLPLKPIWMLIHYEAIFPDSNAMITNGLKFNTNTCGYVRDKN